MKTETVSSNNRSSRGRCLSSSPLRYSNSQTTHESDVSSNSHRKRFDEGLCCKTPRLSVTISFLSELVEFHVLVPHASSLNQTSNSAIKLMGVIKSTDTFEG